MRTPDAKQINKHYNHTHIKKKTKYLEFITHKNYKFVKKKKVTSFLKYEYPKFLGQ